MADRHVVEQESFIQKWAIVLAGGVLAGAVCIYSGYFDGAITKSNEKWGQFGDFLGGVVNPVVGFLTIWLLSVSLRQNQISLSQANRQLDEATDLQQSTKNALQEQIELAEKTRDFANAIAVFKHSNEVYTSLRQIQHSMQAGVGYHHLTPEQVQEGINAAQERMDQLQHILVAETERLREKYPT